MLIEGYEIYLKSISLLLVAFVFLFLVLLSLLEWSGSKTAMEPDNVEPEAPEDEAEAEFAREGDPDSTITGSNYNNKAPASESQTLIDKYIGKVDFNMKAEDLDKPWFHKQLTRAMAQEILKGKDQGTFLVRPSSQRGSYAMSWVKNSHSGEISHSLIHGLFPGFALKQSPTLEERFWSLQSLVDNCPYLEKPIVSGNYVAQVNFQRNVARTSSEVIGRIVEKLYANNTALTEMKWHICILGEGTELYNSSPIEKRTFVRYCDEEYAAPELLPLNGNGLDLVCQALHNNTTLRSLTITGHEGYMRMSFKPNIGDLEAAVLAKMLQVNRSLTHLNLNINQITDTGAKVIAQGLKHNRTLRRLNLSNNFLSSEGLGYFAELLKTNPVLEDLDVRNQLHKNRTNSVTLSCGDNTKQLISLIEDTMRRRAELVSSISNNASSPAAASSSSSPARSNLLAVFHGFLSKKKVEKRLAAHIPGSFLFYLNRYIPNVVFIGIVQEAHNNSPMQSHGNSRKVIVHKRVQRVRQGYIFSGDAPLFQHEIEAVAPKHHSPAPQQTVPTLFEFCAWYISSNKDLLEYGDEWLSDDVLDRLKTVQMLVGLWGVKFFTAAGEKGASNATAPSKSSSRSHSGSSSNSNGVGGSGRSAAVVDNPLYNTSASLNINVSNINTTSPNPSPTSSSTPNPNFTNTDANANEAPPSPTSSTTPTSTLTPAPIANNVNHSHSNHTHGNHSPNHHHHTSSHHSPNHSHSHHSPNHTHTHHTTNHANHANHTNHSNHTNHTSHANHTNHTTHTNHVNHAAHTPHTTHANHNNSSSSGSSNGNGNGSGIGIGIGSGGGSSSRVHSHNHLSNNVFTTITFLVHKNKSWLKYPVQIPPDPPR